MPPGRTKLFSSGKRGVRIVAVGLEPVDRRLVDPELPVAVGERHRQVGADVEELVLDPRAAGRREPPT